jgi:hypothetical protein
LVMAAGGWRNASALDVGLRSIAAFRPLFVPPALLVVGDVRRVSGNDLLFCREFRGSAGPANRSGPLTDRAVTSSPIMWDVHSFVGSKDASRRSRAAIARFADGSAPRPGGPSNSGGLRRPAAAGNGIGSSDG